MHSNKKITEFNMLIVGTGGQGQITLLQVLAEAALIENLDFKSSELHGLSQRGGSVEVHIRFGKQIYSPMVSAGKADLILGLEMQESLMAANFAGLKTNFLVNKYIVPIPLQKNLSEKELLNQLKRIGKDVFLVPATEICQKELGTNVVAGIYLISLASFKKLIPIRPDSILKAMKKIIPEKYLELNLKALNLALNQ
ncbi:MAG: 2-oxoacid:acceptor oxidoreductase family protein [Candidatus Nealsonbacteria bacterium]|nr:2-oxoacid:acceptor oxidoreductase family protein [Candidatus Nealsonbacteria bacterium]